MEWQYVVNDIGKYVLALRKSCKTVQSDNVAIYNEWVQKSEIAVSDFSLILVLLDFISSALVMPLSVLEESLKEPVLSSC